jgi:hypothetical protein
MTNSLNLNLHFKWGKLTTLASKEEQKKKQKPTYGAGKGKGGDPSLRRH